MTAGFLGDEAARQVNDVTPHDGRDQRSRVQRLGEHSQAAERMIDSGEILFEMTADLTRRFQARQHVDETEQSYPQRLVLERPVDHPPEQVLGLEKRWFVLGRFAIKRPRQRLNRLLGGIRSRRHLIGRMIGNSRAITLGSPRFVFL
jgi:hypothetical protein